MAGFRSMTSRVISWPERAEEPPSEVKIQTFDKIGYRLSICLGGNLREPIGI